MHSAPIKNIMAKQTWVYLMHDKRSGFHKIGESKTPVYRERTLQAEQPLIELVEAWSATAADERHLHKLFAHKRVRGEWFNLEFTDYYEIHLYFESNRKLSTNTTDIEDELKESELYRLQQKREYLTRRYIYV